MHLEIRSSSKPNKKYDAIFTRKDGSTKTVHFGDNRYQDFTQHQNNKRRELYILRHEKNETWNDPESPGALSRYILWGNSKKLETNIKEFKKKFGYS